ncbi:MAG: hypothetical protein JSS32_04165 [Verrucomicrobia bacterium]|nr:hypothetical protein [Verrucomicrobiota bacterium]
MPENMRVLLFAALVLSIPWSYKQLTHGFRPTKLNHSLSSREEWDISHTEEERRQARQLLQQTFTYVGRGMQSYVFQSEDQSAVIKLFRRRTRLLGRTLDQNLRIEKTFNACRLAFALAKEETGLLYLHLNPTEGEEPILVIKDRIGRKYSLPLDRYSFAIQKKAEPFSSAIRGEEIDSYLRLIKTRSERGICNTDRHIAKNFGFHQGRAFEIDFGNYIYAPEEAGKEFDLFAKGLRALLEKHQPEAVPEFDQKLEALK